MGVGKGEKSSAGKVKTEDSLSPDGLITYKRRKVSRRNVKSSAVHLDKFSNIRSATPVISTYGDGGNHLLVSTGPSHFERNIEKSNTDSHSSIPEDASKDIFGIKLLFGLPYGTGAAIPTVADATYKACLNDNTMKCRDVLFNVILSENFSSLHDLISTTFRGKQSEMFSRFELIDRKMKNGIYAESPEQFDDDIKQIFEKVQEVGHQIALLAKSLYVTASTSYDKQVIEALDSSGDELKKTSSFYCDDRPERASPAGVQQNTRNSDTTIQLNSCNSGHSANPDQTEASGSYKVCICQRCKAEAKVERCLICDGCEAAYHFSCVEPPVEEIPTQSWYCSACHIDRETHKAASDCVPDDDLHQNCVVCEKLHVMEKVDSGESSVSIVETNKRSDLSSIAISRLCKKCHMCEQDDQKFIICSHEYCPYKFYHIRCLRTSQIAGNRQGKSGWYCPSCLCRVCFLNKDDDRIILCDGCDEAYHIYCLKPPRSSIPKGRWFCIDCNIARTKEGIKKYEQAILQLHSDGGR